MSITASTATSVTRTEVVAVVRGSIYVLGFLLGLGLCAATRAAAGIDPRAEYRVKYVAAGAVYLEGGRNLGLVEGMKLLVKHPPQAPSDQARRLTTRRKTSPRACR
jgi:hypothetical protein